MQSKRDEIAVAIVKAEIKATALKTAVRALDRIAKKHNRNERDAAVYEEMLLVLEKYDLPVADEWKHLCW